MKFISAFFIGFSSPFKGLQLILSNRRLFRTALLPFLLTAAVFIAGLIMGFPLLAYYIPLMTIGSLSYIGVGGGSIWYTILYWVIAVLVWPAAIFGLFYALFLASRLIAAPFFAYLAEHVLIERGLIEDRPFEFVDFIVTNWRLLGVSLFKVLIFLLLGFCLFILSFFPGLGLLTGFGYLLMAAFDVVDMSFEGMRLSFDERVQVFREELPSFFGLAMVMGLVFLVPGLNFFLFPAAVAGGSEIIQYRFDRGRVR